MSMSTTALKVEIKERPIIFSGPMVRAILDGHKTQTRRVLKTQPLEILDKARGQRLVSITRKMNGHTTWFGLLKRDPNQGAAFYCAHGEAGDLLFVREAFSAYAPEGQTGNWRTGENVTYVYRATDEDADISRWYSPIHLPRPASRITLQIKSIRVERLQALSEADAIAEGVRRHDATRVFSTRDSALCYPTAREAFANGWDTINAKRGYSWESNPWVWRIEFKKL